MVAAGVGGPADGSDVSGPRWRALHADLLVVDRVVAAQVAARTGLRVGQVEHLLNRYGSLVSELFELMDERPELREPLPGADEYLKVEAVYAASHEGARHLEDVLTRRTRISIEVPDRGVEAAPARAKRREVVAARPEVDGHPLVPVRPVQLDPVAHAVSLLHSWSHGR